VVSLLEGVVVSYRAVNEEVGIHITREWKSKEKYERPRGQVVGRTKGI
jgi:hypothetical protein